MRPQHRMGAGRPSLTLGLLLLAMGPNCAARPSTRLPPLQVAGAPQALQDAHAALLRAERGEAAVYAPKELAVAHGSMARAMVAYAATAQQTGRAETLSYSVRREVQLAEAVAGQRAAQARSSELQTALTALQEAAASDAWDMGEAQNHLANVVPPAAALTSFAAGLDAGANRFDNRAAAAICVDVDYLFDHASSTLTARGARVMQAVADAALGRPPDSGALLIRLSSAPGAQGGMARARQGALVAYLRARGATLRPINAPGAASEPDNRAAKPMLWHIRTGAAQ